MDNQTTVIIADNTEEFCTHLTNALKRASGFQVLATANDGEQAIRLVTERNPDILVLDLMLAKQDGISVLKAISSLEKRPVVFATSGFITDYVASAAANLGVRYLMLKPCDTEALVDRLEDGGYLATELEHQTLRPTEKAGSVLYFCEQVEILVLKEEKLLPIGEDGMTEDERELFDLLRECRSKLAKANGVAPFMIFSNATLMDMAKKRPRNTSEFKRVSGVGEMKAQWYGKDFLKVLKEAKS